MTLRALIVDDEGPARKRLRDLVAGVAALELVGECDDGPSAVDAIRALGPDVLFLDVQMPEMDGFEVLREVGVGAVPAVVFVTAYDRHALAAFDARAVDYLLKPFTEERFLDTVERVRAALRSDPADLVARLERLLAAGPGHDTPPGRLAVATGTSVRFVDPADITWVEADGNYVRLHAPGQVLRTPSTLKAMAERLRPSGFVRIHQSYLVNRTCIRELQPWSHGEFAVVLTDGTSLVSSRTYSDGLRALLDG